MSRESGTITMTGYNARLSRHLAIESASQPLDRWQTMLCGGSGLPYASIDLMACERSEARTFARRE